MAYIEFKAGVAYFAILGVIYATLKSMLVASNFPRLKGLDKNDVHGIHSRIISGLHCLVSAFGAAWCLRSSWIGLPYFFDGNPNNNPPGSAILVAFEISELIFTTIMNVVHGEDLSIHVHHVAGLMAEIPSIWLGQGLGVMCWVHLAQSTQPFLYGSWICYKLKLTSGLIFPFCSAMTLLLWFIVRVLVCSFPIVWAIYEHRSLYKSSAHNAIMAISVAVFITLNFIWFKALVMKAVRTFAPGKPAKKQK